MSSTVPLPLRIAINSLRTSIMSSLVNGIGMSASSDRTAGTGTGLKVLYQTIYLLNSLNSSKIELSVKDKNNTQNTETGTIVEIIIPTKYSFDISHQTMNLLK